MNELYQILNKDFSKDHISIYDLEFLQKRIEVLRNLNNSQRMPKQEILDELRLISSKTDEYVRRFDTKIPILRIIK